MTLTTAGLQAVQRDITQTFRAEAQAANPLYPSLCTIVKSTSLDEKYGWMGDVPGMKEWLGERAFKQLRAANYTITNKHWEQSLGFERTVVDDDRLNSIKPAFGQLAQEATYHPDELLFETMHINGESTACFDGQFFYDTDHVWGDSGTQSNDLGASATSATDPTTAEFKTAFHAALVAMLGFKNDQGKFMVRPRAGRLGNLVCIVPISMLEAATATFEQTIALEGGAGTSNFVLDRPTVIGVPHVGSGVTGGSDAKFYLHYLGGLMKPFIFQARQPLRFQVKGVTDIEKKEIQAMTEARYNLGYGAWWYSVLTTFS